MKDKTLDNAISRLKSQTQPAIPMNLEQNVWRRIRIQGETASSEDVGFIAEIHHQLFTTGWVVPALALSIAFSAFASTLKIAKSQPPQDRAAHALGFQFITDSPNIELLRIHP